MAKEIGDGADASGVHTAAERVCQKLSTRLSRLVSPAGSQAILSRALHLARADFSFLEQVRAGITPETCFEELAEHINDVEDGEARQGLLAVLGILLDLLVAFIGEDLTVRLVREVWPDLPLREPADQGIQMAQEAAP